MRSAFETNGKNDGYLNKQKENNVDNNAKPKEKSFETFDLVGDKQRSIFEIAKHYNEFFEYYKISTPLSKLFKYRDELKKTHKMWDEEYNLFCEYYKNITKGLNASSAPAFENKLNILFNKPFEYGVKKMNIDDKDYIYLNEIIELFNLSGELFNQTILQTNTYHLFDFLQKDIDKINHKKVYECAIHSNLLCLFIPSFKILDSYILKANMAQIVTDRYLNREIHYIPNKVLLNSLVYDLSDVACTLNSPLGDIRERCYLQVALWEIITNLRNGNLFVPCFKRFIWVFLNCNVIVNYTPETCYVGDEGNFMKKLLSIFSFKPIVLFTKSPQINNFLNYNFINVVGNNPVHNISVIERINNLDLLTYNIGETNIINNNQKAANFINNNFDALNPQNDLPNIGRAQEEDISKLIESFQQIVYENGQLSLKTCEIAQVREMLIIYIPRRINNLNKNTLISHQYPLDPINQVLFVSSRLITGLEVINNTAIFIPQFLKIKNNDQILCLKSGVILSTISVNKKEKIFNGSYAFVNNYGKKLKKGKYFNKYYNIDEYLKTKNKLKLDTFQTIIYVVNQNNNAHKPNPIQHVVPYRLNNCHDLFKPNKYVNDIFTISVFSWNLLDKKYHILEWFNDKDNQDIDVIQSIFKNSSNYLCDISHKEELQTWDRTNGNQYGMNGVSDIDLGDGFELKAYNYFMMYTLFSNSTILVYRDIECEAEK